MESENKEIKCPICSNEATLNSDSEIINCNSCKKEYMYIKCLECSQNIFFNKIEIDGYNIQCPYTSCGQINCIIKCENKKCGKKITYKQKIFQGDEIKCLHCKFKFKKIKCPSKKCSNIIIKDKNFLEGQPIKCEHEEGNFIFQKVGCWHCGRHCVWNNTKGKHYIEGQMIVCPFRECDRVSNKIFCPNCNNSEIVTKGNLDMGKKINCPKCNNSYNIFFCPYCKKTNYGNGNPIVGTNIICKNCKESFYFINCFFCKQINFWKKPNNYLPCQTVVCSNEGCKKKTALIPCISCKKINYFSKGVFILGQKYTCSYRECKNEFSILYCGKCNITHIKQANLDPKILYTCDICKNLMPTIQCPKCFKFCLLENDSKIENHSIFKCPYEGCKQIFYYYLCPFCKHDFNSDIYNSINLKCPFQNCNHIYTFFQCTKCLKENYIENTNNNLMECDKLNCLYCNENNEVINQPTTNILINLKKVNIKQGEKYIFDNPEEDHYDREIINSLIYIKDYEIPFSEKQNTILEKDNHVSMCVICLSEPIQWILVPCGHKCVCDKCEKIIKERDKKCPICKQAIIGTLQKVIDD